jgi:RimJ/RimL family protein N-acetyltransferase
LGVWDREKALAWLEGERHAIKEGTFIIVFEDRPVATACAIGPTSTETRPEFGWVSASPDHQGKGLGYQVSLAALLFIRSWDTRRHFCIPTTSVCRQSRPT